MFLLLKITRKALLCFGLTLAAGATAPATAATTIQAQPIIKHVDIIGARKIPADTVRARIFTRDGDVYDEAALQRDFSSLWNTGYYEDLRIEKEEVEGGYLIHIYLTEKPTIRTIDYKNLNSVTNSDVLEHFKTRKVGLSVENQYDPAKVKKAEVALKELLAEHGRQFATIRTEVRKIPPAAVGITFVVTEGPKVKVGKIQFEGNNNVKSRTLRASMKNLKPYGIPHSIFFENLLSKTYDSTKLQEDSERVRQTYQERGFFKALVSDPKTNMKDTPGSWWNPFNRKPGKAVDLMLPIEEGDLYRLGTITFTGNKAVTSQKALRSLIPMKDGDIFNRSLVGKGLENLRKAYAQLGYINFTSVPETKFDDVKKIIDLSIDLEEGKSYSVRRIEFVGNSTTRDKVIRRELAVEEGNIYNGHLWEVSLLRLNQLQYFEPLRPEEAADIKRNDSEGTVDLTLKVREKGKNTIGLTGGVSGLSGGFIGINYSTNNFLGLGETLSVEFNYGSSARNISFGFTEPYLFDKPINFGFTVFSRKYDYNQLKQSQIQLNQAFQVSNAIANQFQNYSQSSTGFTTSVAYPLRHSFKRVAITYSFDTSSVTTFSTASQQLFEQIAFRTISGPDALKGVITSKVIPSFSFSTVGPNPQLPHTGNSLFLGGEISGLGGNVASIRPIVEWKQFIPMKGLKHNRDGSNTFGYRVTANYITGYRGLVANPLERSYIGGENDLRGFDTRTISPYIFFEDQNASLLVNPDDPCVTNPGLACLGVPKDPSNPRRGPYTVTIPFQRISIPGGDTSVISNFEYRIPIVGPVTVAAFMDLGVNGVLRNSQLKLSDDQFKLLNTTLFGCPSLNPDFTCAGGVHVPANQELKVLSGTNWVPRMSTGMELQVILPIVNAPFRIYYAYNPMRLNTTVHSGTSMTRSMYPAGAAGDFSFERNIQLLGSDYKLREPLHTFRFTVATTF